MYSQLQMRVWQSECDAERDYAIETGNGPDFSLYSVADVLIIFCLVAFACLRAPRPYYRKFGRVIISRGRISTGEGKSYSSSFLHGNNLSMNVMPNWVFQSFCVSLRLNWAFNSSSTGPCSILCFFCNHRFRTGVGEALWFFRMQRYWRYSLLVLFSATHCRE